MASHPEKNIESNRGTTLRGEGVISDSVLELKRGDGTLYSFENVIRKMLQMETLFLPDISLHLFPRCKLLG